MGAFRCLNVASNNQQSLKNQGLVLQRRTQGAPGTSPPTGGASSTHTACRNTPNPTSHLPAQPDRRTSKRTAAPPPAPPSRLPFAGLASVPSAQPHCSETVRRSRRRSRFRFQRRIPAAPARAGDPARSAAPSGPIKGPRSAAPSAMSAAGSEGLLVLAEQVESQKSHSASMQKRNGDVPEQMDFVSMCNKRKRLAPAPVGQNVVRTSEGEYEDSESVIYEYEPDYECGSVVSEASCIGDQQKTLTEVLSYCQAMYDSIQKLDKKLDLLHRKVSEMQHTCARPLLLKPKPVGFIYRSSSHLPQGRVRVQKSMERDSRLRLSSSGRGRHNPVIRAALQNSHVQVNSTTSSVQQTIKLESQEPVLRQSPPLPTIVSTHSLHSQFTAADSIPDLLPQPDLSATLESTVNTASPASSSVMPAPSETGLGNEAVMVDYGDASGSVSISKEVPSSSVSIHPSFEYVGDPVRNVKVLGNYLMKARQKTKPKYAARYLVRVLFPKEVLLCSVVGASTQGWCSLDPNKMAAIREFLAANFPNYDLSEYGKDWKTCITHVNAMIRCLHSETKINQEIANGKEKLADTPDTSPCIDLNCNEDSKRSSQNSQKVTVSTSDSLQNSGWDKFPESFHTPSIRKRKPPEPMELLGSPWRNVQLPLSVIYVAKGKSRPELSARYLIRHLFTEDVLVKSNVYGNIERGMSPLDCNRISALRDFLQENYPSFDLKETGYDWKACVAAINSTIRSLRHDHKKATAGVL
ncbi:BEN domain-containing protein 2 [Excalfactoria chinensis]|uniref:BEN domain-containing protein 2 n=1 Tax=Excalfactoria chinensis TaxID=46218 RepID=UPI003B3AA61C